VNGVDPDGLRLRRLPPGAARSRPRPTGSGGAAAFGTRSPAEANGLRLQQVRNRLSLQRQNRLRLDVQRGGEARNRALFEIYKRDLRRNMEKPCASDPELRDIVNNIWRDGSDVGNGSTGAAIRYERATGLQVKGKWHLTKGLERLRQLERWLRAHPDPASRTGSPVMSPTARDRAIAENIKRDLEDAIYGPL
jgi:hypothetical protein